MVLSAEDRLAQQRDAAAKRQKKEEERLRCAQQFEQDRVDHAELYGSKGTGLQVPAVATPVAAPAAAKAAAAPAESTSVRLQIRATQHWNRVVVFTSFSPDSTLNEVAHALWEELLQGVVGSGSGASSEEVSARMPDEAAIVFVDTVPPRKRWTSQDMQQTLRSAGLCPSSCLLAEVPPIEAPATPAPVEAASAELEVDEDKQSSDEPDDTKGGKGDGAGRGGVSINWIKGGAGKGSAGKGGAPALSDDDDDDAGDDDDDSGSGDDSDDAMSGGKGFGKGKPGLAGRPGPRGGGRGPPVHSFPEGGGQVLGSSGSVEAAGGAALAQYATVVADQPGSSAARDARLAALERRGLAAAPSAAAPKAVGDTGSLARSSADPKGVMYGSDGQTKADRARERQAILQRLQEDKEDQMIRRPLSHASTTTQAAHAETSGVRLQIRCPVSKRVHIAVGFGEASLLGEVLASAAAELGIEDPVLSLGYPPWTEFTGAECSQTLKKLGLCPSATLLIKSAAVVEEAPVGDAAIAVTQATVEAPRDDDSAPPARTCPKNHAMTKVAEAGGWCDKCGKEDLSEAFECKQCDFMLCPECSSQD